MAGQRESRRAFLAAAAGASASLAGCARGALARRSATASSRDLADRIVFYNAGDLQFDPGTRRNIERFEAETGITVEVPEVPWPDLKTTLTTVWNNRSSRIDVWNGPTWWLADFVQSGWLEPLDLPASHMEKFPQNLRDLVTFDGRVYMAPQLGKWGTFLYDSDYLDRLGYDHPPRTWTELLETGEMLTGDERAGFAVPWANKDVFTFKQFLYQAGGQLFDGNEPVFVEEGSVALEFLRRLGDRGVLPADAMELGQPGVRRAFIDGRLATVESWTPLGARTLDADGWDADRLGTAKPPAGPASRATFQDTNGIGVSAFSQRKRAAKLFAEFMTTTESAKRDMLVEGNPSVVPAVYDDPEVRDQYPNGLLEDMRYNLEHAKSETYLAQSRVDAYLSEQITPAMRGRKGPETALEDAAANIRQLYSSMGLL
ncbi:extracellular solute-binding protein [Halosimplex aquaticum]|uniref:Extracellular solute-binding protein n=1 Tax=Halosimplex aquaticum TaxID=3026162 RepID=A0ABD5Y3M6_9EURY|nr:extracellular solute-binding protein [Halosimplex aquaticum]